MEKLSSLSSFMNGRDADGKEFGLYEVTRIAGVHRMKGKSVTGVIVTG